MDLCKNWMNEINLNLTLPKDLKKCVCQFLSEYYIEDYISAFCNVLKNNHLDEEIFNICSHVKEVLQTHNFGNKDILCSLLNQKPTKIVHREDINAIAQNVRDAKAIRAPKQEIAMLVQSLLDTRKVLDFTKDCFWFFPQLYIDLILN